MCMLGVAKSHTQSPGSPGAPKWPPREKQLWRSGCGGAPSAGHRRKCLLDRLSLVLRVQKPHRLWLDPLNTHNIPGLGGTTTGQRKVLGQIGNETTGSAGKKMGSESNRLCSNPHPTTVCPWTSY